MNGLLGLVSDGRVNDSSMSDGHVHDIFCKWS